MDERVTPGDADTRRDPQLRETPVVRRSRLRSRLILALLLVVVIAAGLYWWKHHATQTAAPAPAGQAAQTPPQPVGAATIGTGDIRIILNELGTVTPLDTVTVQTQINGQLIQVGFKEGQVVKKGDFLAQIDPRPYQVALEQAEGTHARDEGLLAQAKSDLQRYMQLGRQDSIAQQQVSDQRFLVQQYTGTVKTDQAAVDNANLNLAYCHIVSPIDGQVGLRLVDPGNYVQTSNASGIAVITQMQPMSVIFSVPQQEVPDIVKQMRAGATMTVSAYDQSNTKLLATGQLSTLDNQIDTTTGTLKLRAQFANANEELYPNEFVNARLLVDTLKNVVRVPVPAVQLGAPGDYVYVINANNSVAVQPVKLGPADNGYQQVLSGLKPGQRVVTDGTDRLSAGVKVTVPAPPAAQASVNGAAPNAAAATATGAAPTAPAAGSGQRPAQTQPPKTQ